MSPHERLPIDNVLDQYHLSQIVTQPTHKGRLLDLVFVPKSSQSAQINHLAPLENHHDVMFCRLPILPDSAPAAPSTPTYAYKRADWQLFVLLLSAMDLVKSVLDASCVDSAWNAIRVGILKAADGAIPKIKGKGKHRWKPWVSAELQKLILEKDRLYKLWKSRGTQKSFTQFKKSRNVVAKRTRIERTSYISQQFSNVHDARTFWSNFNAICRPKRSLIPPLQTTTGGYEADNSALSELLSAYFQQSFNDRDCSDVDFSDDAPADISHHFYCNITLVRNHISNMKSHKSVGLDGISAILLKQGVDHIAPALCFLINRCIRESCFPTQLKSAYIFPIQKITTPKLPCDFRPISILCIVSKIIEKHLVRIISPFITAKLCPTQFGFRPKSSTSDAMLYFDHLISSGLSINNSVVAVFIDVRKAFDTVPFNKLLVCLRDVYDLPPFLLILLKSYLNGRTQAVNVNGCLSSEVCVASGVPQGSLLGPWLFSAYINSVGLLNVSPSSHILMFADDCVLVHFLKNFNSTQQLQADLDLVAGDISNKFLTLNPTKSTFQIFTRPRFIVSQIPVLYLNGIQVAVTDKAKYLGVVLDNKLTYSSHTQITCTKVKKFAGYLYRVLHKGVSPKTLAIIYKSLLRVCLLYCCDVVYPINKGDRLRLEKCQKYVCRLFNRNWDHNFPYVKLMAPLNLVPLWQSVFTRRLCMIHGYVHNYRHCPPILFTLVKNSNTRFSNRLNHEYCIKIPQTLHPRFISSPFVCSAVAFNALPADIVLLSKCAFKTKCEDRVFIDYFLVLSQHSSAPVVYIIDP